MEFVDKGFEIDDESDGINDIEFHSNVRENIVSLLCVFSIWNKKIFTYTTNYTVTHLLSRHSAFSRYLFCYS